MSTSQPKWLRWSAGDRALCPSREFQEHPTLGPFGCATQEGLVRAQWAENRWTASPALAEKVETVTPRQWHIRLKESLKWSDGTSLLASDVADSWRQMLSRGKKYPPALEVFSKVSGIRADGDRDLIVELASPVPDFDLRLASPAAWPLKANTGAGPFRWKEGKLLRNPFYWGPRPILDGVRFAAPLPDSTHRIQAFLAGETDVAEGLSEETLATLGEDARLKAFPEPRGWFLLLSPGSGDEGARRALFQSVSPTETAALLRWPHYPIHGLGLAPADRPAPSWPLLSAKLSTGEKEASAPHVQPECSKMGPACPGVAKGGAGAPFGSSEIAANVQAQWMKNLGLAAGTASPAWIEEREFHPLDRGREIREWIAAVAERWGRWKTRSLEVRLEDAERIADGNARAIAFDAIERDLIRGQALVLPLLGKKKRALVSPRVAGLSTDIFGNWDIRSVDLDETL